MAIVNKKITADELVQNLANARKIIQKVDTGDYEKGNIDEKMLIDDSEEIITEERSTKSAQRPVGPTTPDRINKSKLPDNIKKAMIEHPIPEITLNDGLDMRSVNKARQLMEQEGVGNKQSSSKHSNVQQISSGDLERKLAPIIENIIRKVMDEKLNQILVAQQLGTINENLVLKVGDSIFQGKITGVKSTKSTK